jgi:hydrogenase expression/formation protein HypE
MANKDKHILLGHGSGGKMSHDLIQEIFMSHFHNPILSNQTDSALIEAGDTLLAFTTDSFVVDPVSFPGGDIGKLAIAGTVNDLAVSGATPLYISAAFILEEGLPMDDLNAIVQSMAKEAEKAGVTIVAGDTKVVDRGKCDRLFITTSGIGLLAKRHKHISTGMQVQAGDQIIVNGTLGDHGMAVLAARDFTNFTSGITSDCASLNHLIGDTLNTFTGVHFMRDATRGGLATVLAELAGNKPFGLEIREEDIPVNDNVRGMCELLGYDPLYVANEGKVVMIVSRPEAAAILEVLKKDPLGLNASIIGEVIDDHHGKVWIKTSIGGRRMLDMLAGEQLPRIC